MAAGYPVATISKLLILSDRRVQQLAKDGIIPQPVDGKYDLAGCIQGYIRFSRENETKGAPAENGINVNNERARLAKAQADMAVMTAEKMSGELVSAEDMRGALDLVVAGVRANLLNNTPTRIAARAKSEKGTRKIKKICHEEISSALAAISGLDPATLRVPD